MTIASSLIERSLRLLRVKETGQTVQAVEMNDALAVLNSMLAEWYEAGIGFPIFSIATSSTEVGEDAGDSEAISASLALYLAPEYGKSISPELAERIKVSLSRLRLKYFQAGASDFSELPLPGGYTFDLDGF